MVLTLVILIYILNHAFLLSAFLKGNKVFNFLYAIEIMGLTCILSLGAMTLLLLS